MLVHSYPFGRRGVGAFSASAGCAARTGLRRRRYQTVPSRSLMSEGLQHLLGAEKAEEACEAARARRQRELVAVDQTRAVPAAIADAMDRGEVIGLRGALGGGVGHRPHEFVGNCLMIAAGRSWASPLLSSWLGFSRIPSSQTGLLTPSHVFRLCCLLPGNARADGSSGNYAFLDPLKDEPLASEVRTLSDSSGARRCRGDSRLDAQKRNADGLRVRPVFQSIHAVETLDLGRLQWRDRFRS